MQTNIKSNRSLYSLTYAEACKKLAAAHLPVIAPGQASFFQRKGVEVASHWQVSVQFDMSEIKL